MVPVRKIVKAYLHNYVEPQAKLVVAVSGGADSLALLHVLTKVWPVQQVVVAHLNHGLRQEAQADAEFVEKMAEEWGVAFVSGRVDVPAEVTQTGRSVEDVARRLRYGWLAEVAAKIDSADILTAHHADDQAETVLLNLLRGTGTKGLRGMLPVSPLPYAADDGLRLLRPLLTVTRQSIDTYCEHHHLDPITDASNWDMKFTRNRVRHEWLPALQKENPQISRQLARMADLVAADEAYLAQVSAETFKKLILSEDDAHFELDIAQWRVLSLALRRRTLRNAIAALSENLDDITYAVIEEARRVAERHQIGEVLSLPHELVMDIGYRSFRIGYTWSDWPPDVPQLNPDEKKLLLLVPGKITFADGWVLEATIWEGDDLSVITNNPDPMQVFVQSGPSFYVVHGRTPGQRIYPLGMGGRSAKIQDVMVNRRIPQRWRDRWPIVSKIAGLEAIWVVGHTMDYDYAVHDMAKRIVRLRCWRES